jgi:hypothetical protein
MVYRHIPVHLVHCKADRKTNLNDKKQKLKVVMKAVGIHFSVDCGQKQTIVA